MPTANSFSYASTFIALLSLILSGITLFLTQFRSPRISQIIGPQIQLYYPGDGGFGIYLPVTFMNGSPKAGTILRCGITIFRKILPEERFFMEWRYFMQLRDARDQSTGNLSYTFEENAHGIAVPGNSSTAKLVWITWRATSTPQIRIQEGEYILIFHYWANLADKPINDRHEFHVSKTLYEELESYRSARESSVISVTLDGTLAANKMLSSYESISLLGM